MKKIDTYSAQYKIIKQRKNNPTPPNRPNSQSYAKSIPNKKKLTIDRQEF